jgi:hypothetical protein
MRSRQVLFSNRTTNERMPDLELQIMKILTSFAMRAFIIGGI